MLGTSQVLLFLAKFNGNTEGGMMGDVLDSGVVVAVVVAAAAESVVKGDNEGEVLAAVDRCVEKGEYGEAEGKANFLLLLLLLLLLMLGDDLDELDDVLLLLLPLPLKFWGFGEELLLSATRKV